MRFQFAHYNFNVTDLDRSIAFYKEALSLEEARRVEREGFTLVFLTDGVTDFSLELTWLAAHPQAYDLGENEYHLCFKTDDYTAAYAKHKEMGCICYENEAMGIYFIADPDGYWIEIVPEKR